MQKLCGWNLIHYFHDESCVESCGCKKIIKTKATRKHSTRNGISESQFRIRFFSIASNQDLFSIVKLWFKNGKERVFGRGVVGIKKCEHNFISEENSNRWYFVRWSCYIKTNPNFWSFMLLLLLFSFDTKSLKLIPWSISSFMTSRWLVLDVFFGWNSNFWTFENIFPTLEQTTTKK